MALPVSMRMGLKTGAAVMENETEPAVPAEVVTVTLKLPGGALAAMAKVAVIRDELTTLTLLTVMLGLVVVTVAPVRKLEPLRLTEKLDPITPVEGAMEASAGGAAFVVNVTDGLLPPDVVTVTLAVPTAALAAIVKVAVICAEFTTLTLLTVMPGLLTATMAPDTKLEPVRVTGTLLPCTPLEGVMELNPGGGGATVKLAGELAPLEVVTVMPAEPRAALAAMVRVAVI